MILESLVLTNFKNIADAALEFSPKINSLLGDNGMGKSNLLDALYYLSFCKSFSGQSDAQLIRRGESFAMLRGRYRRRGQSEEVSASLREGMKKSFRLGGKEYSRLGEHIGRFPLVMLSPADMAMVSGGAEERRRFIDQIISQKDARYLDSLIRYNGLLAQRNRMLKDGASDATLLEVTEMQMDAAADYLTRRRAESVERLETLFQHYYRAMAGSEGETVGLRYRSQLVGEDGAVEPLAGVLDRTRRRDELLRFTGAGPHRDDIEMELDGMGVRRSASQGQTKTFTCALRFAQYELLREATGVSPLLLLDDIFDKLDAGRVERMMALVGGSEVFGQIFITDTNRRHLDDIIADIPDAAHRLWDVSGGEFTLLEEGR